MSHSKEVVILSAVRTAIGDFGGGLKDVPPTRLAAEVVAESVKRSGVEPTDIGHCVFGNVVHTEPKDMYLSRVAAIEGGLPMETPALTLNRLCGSGLQAIVSATQLIETGTCESAVAGGAESMSRVPYWSSSTRFGQRMGDAMLIDAMVGALADPFDSCHMGVTAENIAKKWSISREDQDALAVESHHRAARAIQAGYFNEQILPIDVKSRRETISFTSDEHVRADVTAESLAKLRPVFDKEGSVTAGNASGINDAAAAVVLMEATAAKSRGLVPMARIVGYAFAGVDPRYMGIGPVPAVRSLLEKTGVSISDIDLFEVNEAFAAQALAVARDLELPMDKTNPNGSGVSLGHPIGATGCILTVKAAYELKRTGGRYALITMCIGGGQGIAALIERVDA
ncbi:MAG: acetyl-CoA acetyltransferase [marine bacterium B5-7]|nr:MAG: acetyl-CoA acetyltransferase [marine bacterium B5-7]